METTTNPPADPGQQQQTPPAAPPAPPVDPGQQPPAQHQQQANPNLFAGKFENPDALVGGYQSLREKLGLPKVEGPVYGQSGIYSDVTKLERGYKDLETMLGRQQPAQQQQPGQQAPQPPQPQDGPLTVDPAQQQPPADQGVEAILTKAGLTNDELVTQWQTEGKLTDDQYQKLAAANPLATKAMVDQIIGTSAQAAQIQQQQAQQQQAQIRTEAAQLAGGQEQLQNLFGWAATGIPKDELGDPANPAPGTINQRLADPKLYKGAINEIVARHRQAVGAGNSTTMVQAGQAAAPSAGSPATSLAELNKLTRQAAAGDTTALARIQATDPSKFA